MPVNPEKRDEWLKRAIEGLTNLVSRDVAIVIVGIEFADEHESLYTISNVVHSQETDLLRKAVDLSEDYDTEGEGTDPMVPQN